MSIDINTLESIICATEHNIVDEVSHLFSKVGVKMLSSPYHYGDYLYHCNPYSNICLVAHMDTVRTKKKVRLKYDGQKVTNKNGILGADDRAGIYAVYEIARKCIDNGVELPSILITNHEEIGGIGVKSFIDDKNEVSHIELFIEMDRQGLNDYVFYNSVSKGCCGLAELLEENHFVEAIGSYSDIYDLSKAYNIPSVNISTGYFNEHTKREYLMLNYLELNINRVFNIVNVGFACYPDTYLYDYSDTDEWSRESWALESYL